MLESRYPFGRYAEQAQLELIYAHYGAYEFAAATNQPIGSFDCIRVIRTWTMPST